ncbi:hypothetical protein [Mesorhizobium sp. M4B.F.Ca.ET.017.02.2.1]|uniref:hypothetical protein n=1 Tax=Mesorhizobium sp. M4B.F.Ca.ET.017.02.2.1 TaxID=2496649 RepID=UPI001FE1F7B9|nr:hypothetical protein [Mesorhizobium sp. M4B.F.Ca.ET.017.02.2.1]
MIDAISVVRSPDLAGQECRGGKLAQKTVQPPRRHKDVLEMQLGPVLLLHRFGERDDDVVLNIGIAEEAAVSGEIAAPGPQFVVECAVPGPFGSKLKRKEPDIVG